MVNLNEGKLRGVCIGAGNVASSLAPALTGKIEFAQVYSRTLANAATLAATLGCEAVDRIDAIDGHADFYLIALSDEATEWFAANAAPNPSAVWAHTSGSVDASVLSRLSGNYGVFYPLQTFTKGRRLQLVKVPLFIEGSNEPTTEFLQHLGETISEKVFRADSTLRRTLHIAGVLSCNFVVESLLLAQRELARDGFDLSVVEPLVKETLKKAFANGPRDAMTGPARRGDCLTIEKHLAQLRGDAYKVYATMSEAILNEFGHGGHCDSKSSKK